MRLIAEASCNHGGNLGVAINMIVAAKVVGADTVKFQCVSPDGVPEKDRDYYRKVQFTEPQWYRLKRVVESMGLRFLCTPQTVQDLQLLLRIGISEIKISSDNFLNRPLREAAWASGFPQIISTGMNAPAEWVEIGCSRAQDFGMVCTSQYPCPSESVRLAEKSAWFIETKREWGYSDHTQTSCAAILAMGLGATMFEKHFHIDSRCGCPEDNFACTPSELSDYFQDLKLAERSLGNKPLP